MSGSFDFEGLVELCRRTHEETRRSAGRAIDRSLVVRNWLFGWYIVEYEQSGTDRAAYGAQILKTLSAALKERIGRGFSVRYLRHFRRFYLEFKGVVPEFPRRQTVFSVSADASASDGTEFSWRSPKRFLFGWPNCSARCAAEVLIGSGTDHTIFP